MTCVSRGRSLLVRQKFRDIRDFQAENHGKIHPFAIFFDISVGKVNSLFINKDLIRLGVSLFHLYLPDGYICPNSITAWGAISSQNSSRIYHFSRLICLRFFNPGGLISKNTCCCNKKENS